MKTFIKLFLLLSLTTYTFSQNKTLIIKSRLNSIDGKPIEKTRIEINKIGNCITKADGSCSISINSTEQASVNLKAKHEKYITINNLELKSYALSMDHTDTLWVIMTEKEEFQRNSFGYYRQVVDGILPRLIEEEIESVQAYIESLNPITNQILQNKLDTANKQLTLLETDQSNQEDIADRLGFTLIMMEGEDVPVYLSEAFNSFMNGEVSRADSLLNNSNLNTKVLQEDLDKKNKRAIAICTFKAMLKNRLRDFKEAEIWYERAYQADSTDIIMLEEYGYFLRQRYTRAAFEKALPFYGILSIMMPEKHLSSLATILNSLGVIYTDNNLTEQASQAFEKALKIQQRITKVDSHYLPDLAITLNNVGLLYQKLDLNQQAIKSFESALVIYTDLTIKDSSDTYLPNIVFILNSLGDTYALNNSLDLAQEAFEQTVEELEKLVEIDSEKYLPNFAYSLSKLAGYYFTNNQYELSKKNYERALLLYEDFAKTYPEKFSPEVAKVLVYLGIIHEENSLKELSNETFENALKVYDSISQSNLERPFPCEGIALEHLSVSYYENDKVDKAIHFAEKALQIYEAMAKVDSAHSSIFISEVLNKLGVYYSNKNLTEKSQKVYERSIHILEAFAQNNPEIYLQVLARVQKNYSEFWANVSKIDSAKSWASKSLKNHQRAALMKNDDNLWLEGKKANDFLFELISADTLNKDKLPLVQLIIDFSDKYPKATVEEKALAYGSGAWYALFMKEYQLSENYARKGLAIAPKANWIYTNLALALLLQNRWTEAKDIYQKKQQLLGVNNRPLKEGFINDILDLEKAGIKHPDFEKVRHLFKQ